MTTEPWYRTTLRWAQTNLVEIDPARYDPAWWREHWRRTKIQGVIVNAGGIVAYYPTEIPLHHRAVALGDRDLYGEIVAAAREEGLSVIARMDSNRVAEDFYRAHPDWIAVDLEGRPYRQADKYVTCINSPYYSEYLPEVMREIIGRSSPDGFADNSWAGIRRENICHCRHCHAAFFEFAGIDLPTSHDWEDERYRRWVRWNYVRRTEIWELNNSVTQAAGGEHCRWMGMISGDVLNNCNRFIDLPEILARTPIVMLDHQRRSSVDGFVQNAEAGKRLHELAGWDVLIPESMPQYQLGAPAFRLASMPRAEARLWSSSGFAGGIQPWWHHIGSCHEDRRQYRTAEPIFGWHEANEDVLVNREPEADVGIVWSQANHDFHGRNNPAERTLNPYRGAVGSTERAGITALPVHADRIASAAGRLGVLILPNLAAMSDAQIAEVESFVEGGGSVIATSQTSFCDLAGDRRSELGLGRLFGLHDTGRTHGAQGAPDPNIETSARHSYLRLLPELRASVYGPQDPTAPEASGTRHPILAGLEETDTVPFGGYLPVLEADAGADMLATFVPDFPIYPPETSWMRQPRTDVPAIVVRETPSGGRLVWFMADIDRCYAREGQPEHALLLANAVRWCLAGRERLSLAGTHGQVAAHLYRQERRHVIHLNSRLVLAPVPGRQADLLPIGPIQVALAVPQGRAVPEAVDLRVAGRSVPSKHRDGRLHFEVPQLLDHEVITVEWGTAG